MNIRAELQQAVQRLNHSDSPRLDAEVLLCQVLHCQRSYLFTWPERDLSTTQQAAFAQLISARAAGKPVAYLTGTREFWSLPLHVTEATLIPRPDTEILVAQALERISAEQQPQVLDLGTGSGAIALAIAYERPDAQVLGVDISYSALQVAQQNATHLALPNVRWLASHWFRALKPQPFTLIVSNPPYISPDDPHLQQGDVRYEPLSALIAEAQGLAALQHIISQAPAYLQPGGWLCLEHGYNQSEAVQHLLTQHGYGYTRITASLDLGGQIRVSQAQKSSK